MISTQEMYRSLVENENLLQQIDTNIIKNNNESEEIASESLIIFFLFSTLILGGILRIANKKFKIPYTPALFFIGIIAGKYAQYLGILHLAIVKITQINPHGLLQIFLPILVFEAGFELEWHIFRRELPQILTLAFPCVFVNTILMMFSIKTLLLYEDDYYSWTGAWMFGAIVSCTDPIAVVALLKELGASKKFNSLIEGESLINDATGMVLYQLGAAIYKGASSSPKAIAYMFCTLTLGGVFLGLVLGIIAAIFIKNLFNDGLLVVNTTFISGFIAFFLAETVFERMGIMVSGIMTLVSLGCFMAAFGKTRINPEVHHQVHHFWKYLVYAAETIIFFLAGIIVGFKVLTDEQGFIRQIDYYKLIGLYLFMSINRFISLSIFWPLLKKWGYGLSIKEFYVLVYGGLRGAVGISFAMIASADQALDPKLRDIFLFDMSGCAVLTLIINASTTGKLIYYLDILAINPVKEIIFKNFLQNLVINCEEKIENLRSNKYLQITNWEQVKKNAGMPDFYKQIRQIDQKVLVQQKKQEFKQQIEFDNNENCTNEIEMKLMDNEDIIFNNDDNIQSMDKNDISILIETRNRYLMILKSIYLKMLEKNNCSPDSYLRLKKSADWDIDNSEEKMNSWRFIKNTFYKFIYIRLLQKMRKFPLLGNIASQTIFNHICIAYDVVSTYIQSLEKAEQIAINFPIEELYRDIVLKESEQNRKEAENYLYNYLMITFPEIILTLQTKNAASNVLQHQKDVLNKNKVNGRLEDKEYIHLKQKIDSHIVQLNKIIPNWDKEQFDDLIHHISMFQFISKDMVKKLLDNSFEKTFKKNYQIIKEQDPSKYIYIIIRGVGTEICGYSLSNYKETKSIGGVVAYHHIVSNAQFYQSSFISDSIINVRVFSVQAFKKVLQTNIELEAFIWRESLYALSRIHLKQMQALSVLTKESIQEISTDCQFKKYAPGSIFDFVNGGIFLQGFAKLYRREQINLSLYGIFEEEQQDYFRKQETLENFNERLKKFQSDMKEDKKYRNYDTITFFKNQEKSIQYVAVEECSVFHFTDYQLIKNIIDSNDKQDRFSKYSLLRKRDSFDIGNQLIHDI